jgi:hypothetical protein
VLKHIEDASSLFADGKDHPSLNESRNLIQALIDGISTETNRHTKHPTKLPGPTKDRIEYLTRLVSSHLMRKPPLSQGGEAFQSDHTPAYLSVSKRGLDWYSHLSLDNFYC